MTTAIVSQIIGEALIYAEPSVSQVSQIIGEALIYAEPSVSQVSQVIGEVLFVEFADSPQAIFVS